MADGQCAVEIITKKGTGVLTDDTFQDNAIVDEETCKSEYVVLGDSGWRKGRWFLQNHSCRNRNTKGWLAYLIGSSSHARKQKSEKRRKKRGGPFRFLP